MRASDSTAAPTKNTNVLVIRTKEYRKLKVQYNKILAFLENPCITEYMVQELNKQKVEFETIFRDAGDKY